jgi:formate hydrogenlyase subunit 3/multisubunit Na+/H+ antiporter MnhD subunit
MVAPILLLAALTVAIGLLPQPLLAVADRAAAELLDVEGFRGASVPGGGS